MTNQKPLTKQVNLFAKKLKDIVLLPQAKIYFSDNIKIPDNLTKDYPMFNFPARSGGKKAIEFYGIKSLNDIEISLTSHEVNQNLTDSFESFFNSIRPFILSYRLENLEKSSVKESEALKLKNIRITFCNSIICSLEDKEFAIPNFGFYFAGKNNYLVVAQDVLNSNDLKLAPDFADTFAEILSATFDTLTEKKSFKTLLRNDIHYTIHEITQELGVGVIEESKKLLGLSDNKSAFWKIIFDLKSLNTKQLDDIGKVDDVVRQCLNINIPEIYYDRINSDENTEILIGLFKELNISIREFNIESELKINLLKYNLFRFHNYRRSKEHFLKQQIWEYLKGKISDEQKNLMIEFKKLEDIDITEQGAEQLQYDHVLNFKSFFKGLLKKSFKYIDIDTKPNLQYIASYRINCKEFDEEDLITIHRDNNLKSLLYFPNNVDMIKQEIYRMKNNHVNVPPEKHSTQQDFSSELSFRDAKGFKSRLRSKNRSHSGSSPYTGTGIDDNAKKSIGNKAEDKVYNKLISLYTEEFVFHKSKENEGLHYDLTYSKDLGETWIYVEVKSVYSNRFLLSYSEKEFGELNTGRYEVWLVKNGNELIVITNLFDDTLILNPSEYEIIFDEN